MKEKRAIPAGEPGRSQRISIIEGSLANVHITITSGSLMTAYALMLGANDFHLGLMAGLTAISTIGALIGAQLVGRAGRRKRIAIASSVTGRASWIVLCAIPFLPISNGLKLAIFLWTVFWGNGLVQISATPWLSWMTDIVPLERRGRYFSVRNTILAAVAMGTSFAAGHLYDSFDARGIREIGLAVIFGCAVLFACGAGIVLGRQWEPDLRGEREGSFVARLRQPLTDRPYRRLLVFAVLWAVVTGVAGPFFGAHMIKNLGMTLSAIAIYSVLAGTMNLATQPLWGRIVDRVGNRPVLIACIGGVFFLPLLWLFATPERLWPIWLDAVLTGLFWPGFTLAAFNLVLATAPEENRTSYLGMQTLAVGVFTFAASIAGGLAAKAMASVRLEVAGFTFVNFHILFAASAAGRIALVPLAFRLREERAGTVGALVDVVFDKLSQRFNQGWQTGTTVLRRIDPTKRRAGRR